MHILYKLTFTSGKSYIGQTVRDMATRFTQHKQSAMRRDSQLPVHCAWRKHGEPLLEVIGEYQTVEELHAAEILAIKDQGTLAPNGYNVSYGGDTAPSKNPDVAAKISDKAKGRKLKPEFKEVFSQAAKRNWENEEYRQKMSDSLKASWTEEKRKARSEMFKAMWAKRKEEGWAMPESQKEKLRNKEFSNETREKMSKAAKKRGAPKLSQESKNKISKKTAESWSNPEIAEKRGNAISDALKKRFASLSDEDKLAFREKRKKAWETRRLNAQKSGVEPCPL